MEQTDKQKEEAQESKLTGRKAKAKQVIIHACVTIAEANAVHTHSHHALMTLCNVLPTSTYGLMPCNHNALPADNRVWIIKERSTRLPSCYSIHWVKCMRYGLCSYNNVSSKACIVGKGTHKKLPFKFVVCS